MAGLDALVQAITCDDVIGWRRDVRRVIILITDDEPHMAFDGILVGRAKHCMARKGICTTGIKFVSLVTTALQAAKK